MKLRSSLLLLAILAVSACGKEKAAEQAALDSIALADSLMASTLGDTSLATPEPEAVETVYVSRPIPKPTGVSKPAPATAPSPAASGSVASGTSFTTVVMDSVHSRYNKTGDVIRARVNDDVKGQNGRVVIPAGSVVSLEITDIAQAKNRGEKGTLLFAARSVNINGTSFPLAANATDYTYEMKARPVGAGDVGKAGAGAAAGAIVGKVIGGGTGAIIGAVGGAAAGTAVAAKTANRDIIVHAGGSIILTLRDDFSR